MKTLYILLLLTTSVLTSFAQNYTWDGSGSPDTGGNWSTGANWSPDATAGDPGASGDVANLGDVTTGTRTVIYDAAAGGFSSFVQFNQTTAGAVNVLSIQRNFGIQNIVTLGAVAGTEQIIVDAVTAGGGRTLTINDAGGLILNAGGILTLTGNASGVGNYTGNLTISGGSLQVAAATGASSITNTLTGTLDMSSGSLVIDNTGTDIIADRRLTITGNANITGGSISTTRVGISGTLSLTGVTNTINPTTWDTDLGLTLDRFSGGGDQSLTTNASLTGAGMTLRGQGVKTVTLTGGATMGPVAFIDATNTAGVGTRLKLGSDITLASGAAQPIAASFGQTLESGAVQFGIDANGHTFDLSAGAGSGVWTPNLSTQASVTSTVWALSNSGTAGTGVIKANAFNLSSSGVTTTLGAGLVLQAAGGNATANNLGGTGAIDATSTFRYSGSAAAGTPATLASNRSIGNLEVTSGALKVTSLSGIQGSVNVSGGVLLLDAGVSLSGSPSITLGSTGTLNTSAQTSYAMLASQNYVFTLDGAGTGAAGFLNAAGLDITNASVSFANIGLLNDAAYVFASYTSLTGAAFASVGTLPTGYTVNYNYQGLNQIALEAVPEPGTGILAICTGAILVLARRRRNRAGARSR